MGSRLSAPFSFFLFLSCLHFSISSVYLLFPCSSSLLFIEEKGIDFSSVTFALLFSYIFAEIASWIADGVREERIVPLDISSNHLGVWIEKEFLLVESKPYKFSKQYGECNIGLEIRL